MEYVAFVMVPEMFRVTNVADKVVGGMECTILNVGYVMEQVHCNVVRATEPERGNNTKITRYFGFLERTVKGAFFL